MFKNSVETTCSYCKSDKTYLKDCRSPGKAVEEPHGGGGGGGGQRSNEQVSQPQEFPGKYFTVTSVLAFRYMPLQ